MCQYHPGAESPFKKKGRGIFYNSPLKKGGRGMSIQSRGLKPSVAKNL